ncbi:MAG TPA: DNA repair protein RecO [Clostridiales bacterium]|nr:DNA repair protein RecO [Clostridiales bacterium]
MKIVPMQGIVLRYSNFKEADRMLTILTPDRGKIQVLARGCRKQKSRFLSASELFSYCDYMLFEYRDIYILTGADINDVFFDIRNDVERFAYGTYILNLTEISANPEEGSYPLFYLLLYSITMLAYSDMCPEDINNIYQMKLSDILGYRPKLERCVYCDRTVSDVDRFSIYNGGVVCKDCYDREKTGYNIHMGTLQTMRYILNTDLNKLKNLKFTPQVRSELSHLMEQYLAQRLERYAKAKEFIERLKA